MAHRIYIHGGYQSPDIKIMEPISHAFVNIGGTGKTILYPNKEYYLSANVFYDISSTINLAVTFYQSYGGFGSIPSYLSEDSIMIAGPDTGMINMSGGPFHAAPNGQHKCLVVSIHAEGTSCPINQHPDPADPGGSSDHEGCSAWRNTESKSTGIGRRQFQIDLTAYGSITNEPTILRARAFHLTRSWFEHRTVVAAQRVLDQSGSVYPVYLLPALRRLMQPTDLKLRYQPAGRYTKIVQGNDDRWLLEASSRSEPRVQLLGETPPSSAPGDVILVYATARYPSERRAVEFLQILLVDEKRREQAAP